MYAQPPMQQQQQPASPASYAASSHAASEPLDAFAMPLPASAASGSPGWGGFVGAGAAAGASASPSSAFSFDSDGGYGSGSGGDFGDGDVSMSFAPGSGGSFSELSGSAWSGDFAGAAGFRLTLSHSGGVPVSGGGVVDGADGDESRVSCTNCGCSQRHVPSATRADPAASAGLVASSSSASAALSTAVQIGSQAQSPPPPASAPPAPAESSWRGPLSGKQAPFKQALVAWLVQAALAVLLLVVAASVLRYGASRSWSASDSSVFLLAAFTPCRRLLCPVRVLVLPYFQPTARGLCYSSSHGQRRRTLGRGVAHARFSTGAPAMLRSVACTDSHICLLGCCPVRCSHG